MPEFLVSKHEGTKLPWRAGNPVPAPKLQGLNKSIIAVPVAFYKLGGTWDMVLRNGRKTVAGTLDDDALRQLEVTLGCYDHQQREAAEKRLALELYNRFRNTEQEALEVGTQLSWAVDARGDRFDSLVTGPFIELFSGDSSHLRNSIIAPMLVVLIERIMREPQRILLGGQGTDTADGALLGTFDAMTFDTHLPPLILAGANRAHNESNSDAPQNFVDLGRVARVDLVSGAYWVFQGNLYRASDLVKIDPEETRRFEDQSTFLAPHKTNESIDNLLDRNGTPKVAHSPAAYIVPQLNHVIHSVSIERLYGALQRIRVYDLGDQNPGGLLEHYIHDPCIKAIIVAGHSLGNVDNLTRSDLIEAARNGKLVIGTSRTLISATSDTYAASMFSANRNTMELSASGMIIISAHKLNKATARALVVRALLEELDQVETQKLFDRYCISRGLM